MNLEKNESPSPGSIDTTPALLTTSCDNLTQVMTISNHPLEHHGGTGPDGGNDAKSTNMLSTKVQMNN